jgi:hypothetical protein
MRRERPPSTALRASSHATSTPRRPPLLFLLLLACRHPERGCRHTERAAPCRRLGAEIYRLPPRSRMSASSPSGSLRISTPPPRRPHLRSTRSLAGARGGCGSTTRAHGRRMEVARRRHTAPVDGASGTAGAPNEAITAPERCQPREVEEEEDGVRWRWQLVSDAYSSSRKLIPHFSL